MTPPTPTPWGCAPVGHHDDRHAVVFHRGYLVFHTLRTDDPTVITAAARAASNGEDLQEWATDLLVRGIRAAHPGEVNR